MATSSKVLSAASPKPRLSKGDFKFVKRLGSGVFGTVFLVKEKKSNLFFAIKTLNKVKIRQRKLQPQVDYEIQIHSSLDHKHIVKMYSHFEDLSKVYLVLEYLCSGTLNELKKKQINSCFSFEDTAKYLYQVADALIYIHQKNIFHGDLKPSNILVDLNGNIKLADFGLSCSTNATEFLKRRAICGTYTYLAPEQICIIIPPYKIYDQRIDIWAIGILAYELLAGRCPFRDPNIQNIPVKILEGKINYESINLEAADLISKLVTYNPDDRLPLEEVQKHKFITRNYRRDDHSKNKK